MTASVAELPPLPVLPVKLDAAKQHLKVEHGAEDGLISLYIAAAASRIAAMCGLSLTATRLRAAFDASAIARAHEGGRIVLELPRPPLLQLVSTSFVREDASVLVVAPSAIEIDPVTRPARIAIDANVIAGENLRSRNALFVEYDAGFGNAAEDVPPALRQAVLLLTADAFERREPAAVPSPVVEQQIWNLLSPFRQVRL